MKHKIAFIAFFMFLAAAVNGQHYQKDEEARPGSKPQKVGVRIGFGNYWIKAPEMRDGSPLRGIQGAVYYRIGLTKRFNLNVEAAACYRGSRFPEHKGDTGQIYSRLGLFYLELPVLAMISMDKKDKHMLVFGPTVSYLVKPSLFIGYVPTGYFQPPVFTQLPIKPWEFGAALGYMFNTKYVGLYIGYKHGFTNIAGDFAHSNSTRDFGNAAPYTLDEVSPSLRKVRNIYNRSIEFSLYF
ncbi:MAG: hypothetical protein ACYC1Q_06920 [Bacteroidia bacterium]